MSLLSTIGQFVVYYMIKEFKQHIVPFVITLRKIFTIGVNIVYYHHKASFLQSIGVVIVLVAVVYEFASETKAKEQSHTPITQE